MAVWLTFEYFGCEYLCTSKIPRVKYTPFFLFVSFFWTCVLEFLPAKITSEFIVAETQLQIKELSDEVSAYEQGCQQRNACASRVEAAKKRLATAKEEALKLAREAADQSKAMEEEDLWAWELEPVVDTVWKQPPPASQRTRRTTKRDFTNPRAVPQGQIDR